MEDKISEFSKKPQSKVNNQSFPPQTPANRELKIKIVIGMLSVAILLLGLGLMYVAYLFNNSQKVMVDDRSGANVMMNETSESEGIADDATKDWKTYTNEEYGFSFRYPTDWFEYQDEQHINYGTITFFEVMATPLFSQGGHIGNELVTLYVKESQLSLEDYVKKLAKMQNIITEFPPLEIGDQPAVEYYNEYFNNSEYVVKNNNNYLHIAFHNATADTIDQILSTFEFAE